MKRSKRGRAIARKKGTIAELIRALIRKGVGTGAILAAVKKGFRGSKTTPACVSYYRYHMRRDGERVPGARKAGAA